MAQHSVTNLAGEQPGLGPIVPAFSRKPPPLHHRLEPYFYLAPGVALLALVLIVPLVVGISFSFQRLIIHQPFNTGFVGFENYRAIFDDRRFWNALLNTVQWVLWSVLLQLLLGLVLALLLNRPFRGRSIYQALVFLPWAVPAFLTGLMWTWMLNPTIGPVPHWLVSIGLMAEPSNLLASPSTSLLGPIIANVWFGIPFFAITLLAALKAIPEEIYEAARIDGATPVQQFYYVTLPYLAATIAITVLLRTIWIANFPDLIWVMTGGGPANSSQIVSSYVFTTAYRRLDFGYASAIANVMLVVLILYAFLVIRIRRKFIT